MRELSVKIIANEVAKLCVKANKILPDDLVCCIKNAAENETTELPRAVMNDIYDNIGAAKQLDIPICQDTGMAIVFIEIGQEVHLTDGDLYDAINEGVARGYTDGLLRKSVVSDPLRRQNTNDNTPAIVHTAIIPGDQVKITVTPKGFGSENMSSVKMLTPAYDREMIIDEVVKIVKNAGSNPCPPMVIGVGLGGDFEYSAILAKRALCRGVSTSNQDEYYAKLEDDMLTAVNNTDIGPQGFGGKTTALKVNIEQYPTHIAGLPLAVNIGCHVTRHAHSVL